MTEDDALSYEKTRKGVFTTITGSMDNKPCNYLRTDT
jgi:hypothetical protein